MDPGEKTAAPVENPSKTPEDDLIKVLLHREFDRALDIIKSTPSLKLDAPSTWFYNQSPLHVACGRGAAGVVQLILEKKDVVEVNLPDVFGMTPLHHACYGGFHKVVKLLLEYRRTRHNMVDKDRRYGSFSCSIFQFSLFTFQLSPL